MLDSVSEALHNLPAVQFRGGGLHESEDLFSGCRKCLSRILGIKEAQRIFFSSGATESLNTLFSGLKLEAGSVITTATEHNSVLRPLYNRPESEGKPVIVPCDENGFVDPEDIRKAAKAFPSRKEKAIVLNHCSNVTGAVQDCQAIGAIAKELGFLFVLDCSQSAGCIPIMADAWQADALAFTGHKSLLGIQGTGGYYVRDGLSFRPARFGGTGHDSRKLVYAPGEYEYEPGTQNSPGIVALKAACDVILTREVRAVASYEARLRSLLVSELEPLHGIRVIGTKTNAQHLYGPVVSFTIDGLKSADVSYILQNSYGILTRAGLMCAPLIHRCLGTEPDGVVRVSFSVSTTEEDLLNLCSAVKEILAAL